MQAQAQGLTRADLNREQEKPEENKICLLRCPGWMCELMGYWPYSCMNLPKNELFVAFVVIQSVDTEINLFGTFCFIDKKKTQQTIFLLHLIYYHFLTSQCCFHFWFRGQLLHSPARNNYSIIVSLSALSLQNHFIFNSGPLLDKQPSFYSLILLDNTIVCFFIL